MPFFTDLILSRNQIFNYLRIEIKWQAFSWHISSSSSLAFLYHVDGSSNHWMPAEYVSAICCIPDVEVNIR